MFYRSYFQVCRHNFTVVCVFVIYWVDLFAFAVTFACGIHLCCVRRTCINIIFFLYHKKFGRICYRKRAGVSSFCNNDSISVLEFQDLVENSYLPLSRWEKLPKAMQIKPKIAVAMSGGAHSSCLAILLARWCAEFKAQSRDSVGIVGFTVDHNLSETSRNKAHAVSNI